MTPTPLSLEAKQQSLYACLLTHSPEFGSLRDRAVDRLVLGGLLGSSSIKPYKIGEIQQHVHFGPDAPQMRPDVIRISLDRLSTTGKVDSIEIRKKNAYFLTDLGTEDLGTQIDKASKLFDEVAKRMLANTDHLMLYETGSSICRQFISECFARFGMQLARGIWGESSNREFVSDHEIHEILMRIAGKHPISDEAMQSLEQRCIGFLKSREPTDEKLKFFLTQSYYLSQLIGYEGTKFNPLSEDAFASSVFFLDTNVILPGIIPRDDNTSLFQELTRIAQQLKLKICVTRATINETRRVAFDKKKALHAILPKIPTEVLDAWNEDPFLLAFLEQHEKIPTITIDEFMEPFERLPEILAGHGILIDDTEESDYHLAPEYSEIVKIINEESIEVRQRRKPEAVLRHDICHFLLIMKERVDNPKIWFLTNDRSLVRSAQRFLREAHSEGSPFCFSVLGFLQSVSPFITSSEAASSLADVFSAFLSDQVMPTEQLFDIQELKLIAEMHGDILSTPPEKLIQAFDFAKKSVLMGRHYQNSDVPIFALGIKKFLASSAEEQRKAIQEVNDRLQAQLREEAERRAHEAQSRSNAEVKLSNATHENDSLKQTVNHISDENNKLKNKYDQLTESTTSLQAGLQAENVLLKQQQQELRTEHQNIKRDLDSLLHKLKQAARFLLVLISFAISLYFHINPDKLQNTISGLLPGQINLVAVSIISKICSIILLFTCLVFQVPFFRAWQIAREARIALFSLSMALLFWLHGIANEGYWSAWSSYVQIAGAVAIVFYLGLRKSSDAP